MKAHYFIVFAILCVFLAGCAEIEIPRPERMLQEPVGSGGLKRGMTKSQVISIYGDPGTKRMVSSAEWNQPREEWLYDSRYTALPLSAGFLSEDLYLYFDGENLTNIERKPLGEGSEEVPAGRGGTIK